MEMENQVLEILDEGNDATMGASGCCAAGQNVAKIK